MSFQGIQAGAGSLFDQQRQNLLFRRALVTANKDPDQLGRIQVSFPWLSGKAKDTPTSWARLCLPYASQENGMWFIPEVGDEVLVVFESSNIANPIVIGTFYGGKNKPPKSGKSGDFNGDGRNNLKFIKTRSGNTLTFDDSPGNEGIEMKDKSGATIKVEKGKIAIGNQVGELLDLLEQLLSSMQNSAPTLVSTAMGPGIMNPSLMAKIVEVKSKIGMMKGTL